MEYSPFIDRPMSILLDLVRGLAALAVLVGHMVQFGFYTGPYPFGPYFQHNAVVVFFVLSGLVISSSVFNRASSLPDYVIARVARILPVVLFALLFGSLCYLLASQAGLRPSLEPARFSELDPWSIALSLLFLNETGNANGPVWNPPYWSLAYEVWFYAIFGAAYFIRGTQRWACLALLLLCAGWRIVLMLPVWLFGVAIARFGGRLVSTPLVACTLAGLSLTLYLLAAGTHDAWTPASMAALGMSADQLQYSGHFLTDYVLGLSVCAAFLAARPFAGSAGGILLRLEAPIRTLAGFSFTLYLVHWPMLSFASAFGVPSTTNPLTFAAMAMIVIAASAAIACVTEHRSGLLRRKLQARWEVRHSGMSHSAMPQK